MDKTDQKSRYREGRPFSSLRARMAALFTAIIIIAFSAAIYLQAYGFPPLGIKGNLQFEREQTLKYLGLVADIKKHILESWLEERIGDIKINSSKESFIDFTRDVSGRLAKIGTGLNEAVVEKTVTASANYKSVTGSLHLMVESYRQPGSYKSIEIIDAATARVTACSDAEHIGHAYVSEPFVTYPLETGKHYIGLGRNLDTGAPELRISDRIGAEAVLVAYIDIEKYFVALTNLGTGLGDTGEVVMLNSKAELLHPLKFPLESGFIPKPLETVITAAPARLAASGKEGVIENLDYRGVEVLAAYRNIAVSPVEKWGMVVKEDADEILRPIRELMIYDAAGATVIALAVIVAVYLVASGLSGPIEKISAAAREVERGNYQVAVPAGDDEIGLLGANINFMIEGIRSRKDALEKSLADLHVANELVIAESAERARAQAALRESHNNLEKTVAARTAELRLAVQELESFAYTVSHDLRAPLRTMTGFAELIAQDYAALLDDNGKHYIERIRAGAARLEKLISAILLLSRVSRKELKRVQVNLSKIARQAASDLDTANPARRTEWKIMDNVHVMADTELMRSVMQNLLGNAWKFSAKTVQPVIEFGAAESDGVTWCYVRDNGAGFDMRHAQGKLFGTFERLHTDAEFEGTGIGLATVRRIIQRHGGNIVADAKPGEGAEFRFNLGV